MDTDGPSRRRLLRSLAGGLAGLYVVSELFPRGSVRAQSPATPAESPAYAAALQPEIEQLIADLLVPAAAVVVQSPQLGDHVRIGSNTKTMTGTVILELVDEGSLNLDDPVATYRPEVPNGDQITIAQLLEMRSGLYHYTESPELNQALDETPTCVWSPDELLAIAFPQPPSFAPGAAYQYSNTNYIPLGLIIEQFTGDSAENALRQRIFDPLGLTQTLLPALNSNAIPDPYPQGYMYSTNVEPIASQVLPAGPGCHRSAAAAGCDRRKPLLGLDSRCGDLDGGRPYALRTSACRRWAAQQRDAGTSAGQYPANESERCRGYRLRPRAR